MPKGDAEEPPRPSAQLRQRATELRRSATLAEQRLWYYLRGKKLGVKVRRQHAIGQFIVDFCVVEHDLVIEIDGSIHNEQIERDEERTAFLEAAGYRVLRFSNERALNDTAAVLAELRIVLKIPLS